VVVAEVVGGVVGALLASPYSADIVVGGAL
jgi:hypothetical protein